MAVEGEGTWVQAVIINFVTFTSESGIILSPAAHDGQSMRPPSRLIPIP